MAEYYVADTYKNYERIGQPFEKKGRLYTKAKCKCDRCTHGIYAIGVHNGELVPHPAYNGVCLKCNGTGYVEKEIRLYTEKEHQQNLKNAEKRKMAREAAEAERASHMAERAKEMKKKWFIDNNFTPNGLTYCVVGDNTYAIKDSLKELGCKFSPIFMWHVAEPIPLPDGYSLFLAKYEDYMTWDESSMVMSFKEDAKELIQKKIAAANGSTDSDYLGEIKDRLYNIPVTFVSKKYVASYFGDSNIYTFKDKHNNILTWFTSCEPEVEVGKKYLLTGTVKKHMEYQGVKQTQFSRCKINAFT